MMEEWLNSAQTLGVFAVFAILVLREVLSHKDKRNGNGSLKQLDDLSRWQFPRIEEAITQLARAQEKQTKLLEKLTTLVSRRGRK